MPDGKPVETYMREHDDVLVSRGKVRDLYRGHMSCDHFYSAVATDRVSIFDFVLPAIVPDKGEILTALTNFWLTQVLTPFKHHLLPYKNGGLRGWPGDFPKERTAFIEMAKVQPFEMIFRAHIGGSVWKTYKKGEPVAGQTLPAGLKKWQKLDEPIFTPSTKEDNGHDQNITVGQYYQEAGYDLAYKTETALRAAYKTAYELAWNCGIAILDTKFEVSNEPWMIVDEILTPDSSRFTTVEDYEAAMKEGRDPVFYDKEPVRAWGRTVATPFNKVEGVESPFDKIIGINNLDPSNDEHVAFVHSLAVPEEVIADTTARYHKIFEMLTGMTLAEYQQKYMAWH